MAANTRLARLSDNTIRLLISETEGALACDDYTASREYGGVIEAMRRYGDGWRKHFSAQLDDYRAERDRRQAERS